MSAPYKPLQNFPQQQQQAVPPPYQANQFQPPQHYVQTAQPPTTVIVQQQHVVPVGPGACPVCRVGSVNEEYTALGICLAIWFFPIGILCCLAMTERRCSNCGAHM